MAKGLTVQGIYVGSVAMLERMVRSITASGMQPVIDRSFVFDDAAQAYAHLEAARHFGKVVIEIRR